MRPTELDEGPAPKGVRLGRVPKVHGRRRVRLLGAAVVLLAPACGGAAAMPETTGHVTPPGPEPEARASMLNMTVEAARALDEYTRRTQDPAKLPPEGYLRFATVDGSSHLDIWIEDIEKLQMEADADARSRIGAEDRPDIRFVFGALDRETFSAISGLVCDVGEGGHLQSCTEDPTLTEKLRRH